MAFLTFFELQQKRAFVLYPFNYSLTRRDSVINPVVFQAFTDSQSKKRGKTDPSTTFISKFINKHSCRTEILILVFTGFILSTSKCSFCFSEICILLYQNKKKKGEIEEKHLNGELPLSTGKGPNTSK